MVDLDSKLSRARERVEPLLLDTCEVRWDREGGDDDVLNETTGVREPPVDDDVRVWTGPCAVLPATSAEYDYEVLLPMGAPAIRVGMTLTVKTSTRDPQLRGRLFTLASNSPASTYVVLRRIPLQAVPT